VQAAKVTALADTRPGALTNAHVTAIPDSSRARSRDPAPTPRLDVLADAGGRPARCAPPDAGSGRGGEV